MDLNDPKNNVPKLRPEPTSWIEILQSAFDGLYMPDHKMEAMYDHFERMP